MSGAQTWQLCNRKYYFQYEKLREPRGKSMELRFGSAWHALRDGKPPEELPELEQVRLTVLNECYGWYWSDSPLEVVAREEEFAVEGFDGTDLDENLLVIGRIDGRTATSLVEYKTTSTADITPGSLYWERVLDDMQIHTYMGAMWHMGRKFTHVTYDVARKPLIKRRASEEMDAYGDRLRGMIMESPENYFQRRDIELSLEDVASAWEDIHTIAYQIPGGGEHAVLKDYPRNRKSCYAYNRPCEYLPVCRGETTIGDNNLYQVRIR